MFETLHLDQLVERLDCIDCFDLVPCNHGAPIKIAKALV